jgi:SAM-dependent methyltransferase
VKVLLVNGSPNKEGCTYTALCEVEKELKAQIQSLNLAEKVITSSQEWHNRYCTQERWTDEVRRYLFRQLNLAGANRVLEVGCGTGAVLAPTEKQTRGLAYGLDMAFTYLELAKPHCPQSKFTCGDGLHLPYRSASFNICYTHYFLLWVKNPVLALEEMRRVACPGGYVIALAEPDYRSRIDFPPVFEEPGRLQRLSLESQGADPDIGRRLSSLFRQSGLKDIHTGLLGGQWGSPPPEADRSSEWQILQSDLNGLLEPARIEALHALDNLAWECGERILFIPTFYAWGKR